MAVEITLTMDILVEQGNNIHKWFDLQIAEKARAMGIRDEFLQQLDQNVEVLDSLGGVYGSYGEFAEKISPEKFPIVFKFSTHPTVRQQQLKEAQIQQGDMPREGLLRRMSQEFAMPP